jgi:hypothetical protein
MLWRILTAIPLPLREAGGGSRSNLDAEGGSLDVATVVQDCRITCVLASWQREENPSATMGTMEMRILYYTPLLCVER